MLLWSALGYFLPLTSTLVLKFLKPKNRAEELKGNQKSSTIPGERETGGIISRGIAGSEVVDKVLSWVFDEDPPRCPSCRALLATKPKRKTICPFCGKAIYVRTNSSGYTELLNEGHLRFYKR